MSTSLRITLAEYDEMIRDGAFEALRDRRIELIRGEIKEMNPPGARHENVIDKLTRWSIKVTDEKRIRIRVQNSIGLPNTDSAPQPDIAWVHEQDYDDQRPQASDTLLVIEVAHSSVQYDRQTKSELYAGGGIPEYWIVNIPNRTIEVRRDPANGEYGTLQTIGVDGRVQPLAEPSATLKVSSILGA